MPTRTCGKCNRRLELINERYKFFGLICPICHATYSAIGAPDPHPWYGPCDAMLVGGGCYECERISAKAPHSLPEARRVTAQAEDRPEKLKEIIMAQQREIVRLREALKETLGALESAFCHDEVDTPTLMAEIGAGRWDGVRGMIEKHSDLLKKSNQER